MAEASQAPDRPHAGGVDLLTQALEASRHPVEPGLVGHPAAEPPPDDGLPPEVAPATSPLPPTDTGTQGPTPPAPPASPAPPVPQRYASLEEADRAAVEAQRRMQEAAEEAAYWRRRAVELEQRPQPVPTTPEPPTTPQPTPAAFDPKAHFQQAYQRMAELDPTADEYEVRQQAIFTEALEGAFRQYEQHSQLSLQQIEQRVQQAAEAAARQVVTQERQQTHQDSLRGRLLSYATEHGLDVRAPSGSDPFGGRHYNDLMHAVNNNLYPADANEDTAIAAVVDVVRNRWGINTPLTGATAPNGAAPPVASPARPAGGLPPSSPSSAPAATFSPMERSGPGRPAETPTEMDVRGYTLSEVLERSKTMRRP